MGRVPLAVLLVCLAFVVGAPVAGGVPVASPAVWVSARKKKRGFKRIKARFRKVAKKVGRIAKKVALPVAAAAGLILTGGALAGALPGIASVGGGLLGGRGGRGGGGAGEEPAPAPAPDVDLNNLGAGLGAGSPVAASPSRPGAVAAVAGANGVEAGALPQDGAAAPAGRGLLIGGGIAAAAVLWFLLRGRRSSSAA